MRERRQHKRFRVDVVEINGKMMLADEVKILDISIGGVSLTADRRLNMGGEYAIKLEDKGKVLTVKGTVVWSVLSGNKKGPDGEIIPVYTAGMKFVDVSDKKINEIADFIENRKQETVKQAELYKISGFRHSVRVHIDAPERASLNSPENYRVKILSLGGMLIESEYALETESRLSMEITLPASESIKFLGRIASCRLVTGEETKHFDIGIEFADMSAEDRKRFSEFVFLLSDADSSGLLSDTKTEDDT